MDKIRALIGLQNVWMGEPMEACKKSWYHKKELKDLGIFPIL
jgi:hypothetical protein